MGLPEPSMGLPGPSMGMPGPTMGMPGPSTGRDARAGRRAAAGARCTGESGSASMRTAQKLVCSYRQERLDLSLEFGSYVGGAEASPRFSWWKS